MNKNLRRVLIITYITKISLLFFAGSIILSEVFLRISEKYKISLWILAPVLFIATVGIGDLILYLSRKFIKDL